MNKSMLIFALALAAGGKTLASGRFRTWKSDVPIAKTVVIDPKTATYPIGQKGLPLSISITVYAESAFMPECPCLCRCVFGRSTSLLECPFSSS